MEYTITAPVAMGFVAHVATTQVFAKPVWGWERLRVDVCVSAVMEQANAISVMDKVDDIKWNIDK